MKVLLGDYMKFAIWWGGFFWCWKCTFLYCWAGFFPHIQGFPRTVGLEECAGQSTHARGNKQNERRGKSFGKMGDTGVIIQGDNSAGHCFVIRDLIPMNFFKLVVIMKLKMCSTGNILGEICLKSVRDTFFQCVVCNQEKDGVKHEEKGEDSIFWWGVTSKRRVRFKILGMTEESPILITHKKHPEEFAWSGLNTVTILKRVREYIFF